MEGIDAFVSNVAAAQPLPGGGSVAAMAGALAAALGEMMAGLTEGREKFASVQPRVVDLHAKLARFRNSLRTLVEADAAAYQSLLEAFRLPQETEAQSTIRAEAIQKAAKGATETPLHTARAASEVLECLKVLAEIGNPNARSDVAVGAQLAYASLKGAQYNVLTNIRALKDEAYVDRCRTEISGLIRRGSQTLSCINNIMEAPD